MRIASGVGMIAAGIACFVVSAMTGDPIAAFLSIAFACGGAVVISIASLRSK